MKTEIINRLLSRKFWIAVLTLIVLALNEQWNEFVVVALGYIGVQGVSEAITGRPTTQVAPETVMSQNIETTGDTIITGAELE